MSYPAGWAAPFAPKSRIAIPKREWNVAPPITTGDTPVPEKGKKPWSYNPEGVWRQHPNNPMRRVPPRREPEKWKEPKRYIAFARDGGKENEASGAPAEDAAKKKNEARYGYGVSAPAPRNNPKPKNKPTARAAAAGQGGRGGAAPAPPPKRAPLRARRV